MSQIDLLSSGNSFGTLETSRRTVNSWESLYFSLMKRYSHLIRLRRSYIPVSVSFLEKPYYLTLIAFNVGYGAPAAEPRPGGARDLTGIADLRVVGVGEEKCR